MRVDREHHRVHSVASGATYPPPDATGLEESPFTDKPTPRTNASTTTTTSRTTNARRM